jgi:hypothetical protein
MHPGMMDRGFAVLTKQTPWFLVRKPNVPTELASHVGEVNFNFCRQTGVAWEAQRVPTAVNFDFRDRSRYFFVQVAP